MGFCQHPQGSRIRRHSRNCVAKPARIGCEDLCLGPPALSRSAVGDATAPMNQASLWEQPLLHLLQEAAAAVQPKVQAYLTASGASGTATVTALFTPLPAFTVGPLTRKEPPNLQP